MILIDFLKQNHSHANVYTILLANIVAFTESTPRLHSKSTLFCRLAVSGTSKFVTNKCMLLIFRRSCVINWYFKIWNLLASKSSLNIMYWCVPFKTEIHYDYNFTLRLWQLVWCHLSFWKNKCGEEAKCCFFQNGKKCKTRSKIMRQLVARKCDFKFKNVKTCYKYRIIRGIISRIHVSVGIKAKNVYERCRVRNFSHSGTSYS